MTGRRVRALFQAVAIAAVLVAAPVALAWWAGWPLPHHWPTGQQWSAWLDQPLTLPTIRGIIVCLLWLMWATVIVAAGAEVARQIRGMRKPTLRLPGPLQTLAATLVGPAMAGLAPHTAVAYATVATVPGPTSPPPTTGTATASADAPVLPAGVGMLLHRDCGYPYTVRRGDSLWHIADLCLGDGRRWPQIWQLNHGRFWPAVSGYRRLADPDLILPGWTLRLPEHATPPPHVPAHRPHPGPGPTSPSAHPAPTHPAPHGGTHSPAPSSSVTSTAATDAATPGLDLPDGGWVELGVAATIAATATLLWRLRRHRRTQPTNPQLNTPTAGGDLAPLSATVTQIQQRLRHRTQDIPAVQTAPTVQQAAPPATMAAPAGAAGTSVELSGPGAPAAARGRLITALFDTTSGGHTQVIIARPVLDSLLGQPSDKLPCPAQLTVTDTTDTALGLVDQQILHRSRLLHTHDVTDLAAVRVLAPAPDLQPLLLITDTDTDTWRRQAIAGQGHDLDITVLTFNATDSPTSFEVTHDGIVVTPNGPTSPGRWSVLTPRQAVDLLITAAEVQPGPAQPALAAPPAPAPTSPIPARTVSVTEPRLSAEEAIEPNALTVDAEATPRPPARIQILGPAQIVDLPPAADRPVLRSQALELLVYMAVHRHGVTRDQLLDDLFGYVPRSKVNARLNTCVYNLRTVLKTVGGQPPYLIRTGDRYQLDPNAVTVDLWTWQDACDLARATTDQGRQMAMLAVVVEGYPGNLAADSGYEWIEPAREAVRRDAITLHELLADLHTDRDPATALRVLQAAIALDPYNETLYQKAMRLGTPAQARALLNRLTARLAEIDSHPSSPTVDLATV